MAVNKSARQNDEFTEMNAFLAVDGNLSTCSYTSLQVQPWWEVNFGQRFIVQGLVLDVPQDNLRMYYFQFPSSMTERRSCDCSNVLVLCMYYELLQGCFVNQ